MAAGGKPLLPELDFEGFTMEDTIVDVDWGEQRLLKKMCAMANAIREVNGAFAKLEDRVTELEVENSVIRSQFKLKTNDLEKENKDLRKYCTVLEEKLKDNEKSVKANAEKVKEMKGEHAEWKKEHQENRVNFREIIETQRHEKENLAKEVVKVIKEKENIVRETVDKKKCVMIFGLKEKVLPLRHIREKEERRVVKEIFKEVKEENDEIEEEIEEVSRIGKYEEGGSRPIKVKLRSQVEAEEILQRAWRLSKKEGLKRIFIRRLMNEEERNRLAALFKEAQEKNSVRTESERKSFYWRVKDERLRKWYLNVEGERTTAQ